MLLPKRTLSLNNLEAEIDSGGSRHLTFNAFEQYVRCRFPDVVARNADRCQRRNDLSCQFDVIEAGNSQILRYADAATLTLQQSTYSENVVGKENGLDFRFAGTKIVEAFGAGLERKCRLTL